MQDEKNFYPVKIVSRSIAKRRLRRVSWCALGAAFGMGCVSAASPMLTAPQWVLPQAAVLADFPPQAPQEIVMASAPAEKVAAAPALYPMAVNLKVGDGDTLIDILKDTGVSYDEANNAVSSLGKVFNPKKLDVGQSVTVALDKAADSDLPYITSLKLPVSATSRLEATRAKNDTFSIKKIDAPVEKRVAHAGGRIDSSLYETGTSSGMPAALLGELIKAYSYDVDFQRDIQPGNMMDVLYEKMQTKDGIVTGHGNLLFAELELDNRTLKFYRYVDKSGNADYYNEKGESLRKALLRTPLPGAQITSGYGMRNHPLLGYSKMHRGVDFGAPSGTPIYAAGDGTIEFASRKGGYGNYLVIQHNAKYASAYGHISRFAAGMAPGKKVKQGQVVAYVGSTGMSTGPHLHYEILMNHQQVNPSGLKFKTGNVLGGKELASFKKNMATIQAQLESTPRKTDLAMADAKGNTAN